MRPLLLMIFFLLSVFTRTSYAQKAAAKAVYTHDFPKQMNEDVKKAYLQLFEKGQILYGINCAKCHNTVVKGVELMPEFTKEHLAKYELRIQNPQHAESLSEMRVTAEELQQIMIFLTYYKKTDQTLKVKK